MKVQATTLEFVQATVFLGLIVLAPARFTVVLVAYVIMAAYIPLANLALLRRLNGREQIGSALVAFSLILMVPVSALRNPVNLVHCCVGLSTLACAFILTRNVRAYLAASRLTLVAAQAGLLAYVAYKGVANFPLGELLAPHTSANGITAWLVMVQANYSTIRFLVDRRTSLATSFATLLICIVGFGRGSILAAAGFVTVNLLWQFARLTPRRIWIGTLLIAAVAAAVHAGYGAQVKDFMDKFTKIGAGLYDPSRAQMIQEYLGELDPATLLVGADYSGTTIGAGFFDNPHNSYIRAHHVFGLPYLVAVLVFPLIVGWRARLDSARIYAGCMLVLMLGRAITEAVLFPTPFDVYYFAICFALSTASRQAAMRITAGAAVDDGMAGSVNAV
jgi:hypothetical protein